MRPTLTLLLLGTLLLSGCLSYKEVVMHDIVDVDVRKLDMKGVDLTAHVMLENPNGYRIHVKDPDVDLYLNGTYVGKGILDSSLVLDRKTKRVFLLGGALSGEMNLGAKGTVVGQAGLLRKRFPFDVEEKLEMPRN